MSLVLGNVPSCHGPPIPIDPGNEIAKNNQSKPNQMKYHQVPNEQIPPTFSACTNVDTNISYFINEDL